MNTQKKRFVLLIDVETYEKFQKLAKMQNRTAGNLGATLVKNFVKDNYKE